MPTYDYQCRSCGHTIEVIHSMKEEGPTTCEVCGGELRRILHPAGIIFRGSGFYKTDSRSASSASVPAASTKKPSGPPESGKGSGDGKGADAGTSGKTPSSGDGGTKSSSD